MSIIGFSLDPIFHVQLDDQERIEFYLHTARIHNRSLV